MRYFTAVAGDKKQQGELFGLQNIFAFRADTSCLTKDLIQVREKPLLYYLGTFCNRKHNVHRLTLNFTPLEHNDSGKLTLKYYLLRCCSFCEMSKTMSRKYVFTRSNNFSDLSIAKEAWWVLGSTMCCEKEVDDRSRVCWEITGTMCCENEVDDRSRVCWEITGACLWCKRELNSILL